MATYTVVSAAHKTLSGTTVDTVILVGRPNEVTVSNRAAAGGADIFFVYGSNTDPASPVVAGDETRFVSPGGFATVSVSPHVEKIFVKVIGNSNAYSVEGQ